MSPSSSSGGGQTQLALESIYVKIYADASDLVTASGVISKTLDAIEVMFMNFREEVRVQTSSVASAVQKSFAQIEASVVGLGTVVGTTLRKTFNQFSQALADIGRFLTAVTKADLAKIDLISPKLKEFGIAFEEVAKTLSSPQMIASGAALRGIGVFVSAAQKMTSIDFDYMGKIRTEMSSLLTILAGFKYEEMIGPARALDSVAYSLNALNRIDPAKVSAILTPLTTMMAGLEGVATEEILVTVGALSSIGLALDRLGKVNTNMLNWLLTNLPTFFERLAESKVSAETAVVISSLGKLSSSLAALSRLKPATLEATFSGIASFMTKLSAVPIGQASKLTEMMASLAEASRSLSATTGVVPMVRNLNSALNATAPAADASTRTVNRLGSSMRGLSSANRLAQGSLAALQLTMTGMAAYGLFLFAKLDDTVTRTLAHMRDFSGQARGVLEQNVLSVAGRSRSGISDVAAAQDVFASRGMSAGMAGKALPIAETFAVASGMKVADAAKKQIDILQNLGLVTQDVTQDYKELTRVSDVLVGVSRETGSTEEELADALGGRLGVQMHALGIDLEEGAALMGVYSERMVRGTEASDRANQFILNLTKSAIEHKQAWEQLGISVYGTDQKLRPLPDIMMDLDSVMGGLSSESQEAALRLLGFENRAIGATLPLIGMGEEMKRLMGEMKDFGGLSEKVADMLRHDFVGQVLNLWNNFSILALKVGSVVAPAFAALAGLLGSAADSFGRLNPAVQNLVIVATAAGLAFFPLMASFRWLAGSLILGPLNMIGSALKRVGLALWDTGKAAFSAASSVAKFLGDMWNRIFTVVDVTFRVIIGVIGQFIVWVTSGVEAAATALIVSGKQIAQIWYGISDAIVYAAKAAAGFIVNLVLQLPFILLNILSIVASVVVAVVLLSAVAAVIATAFFAVVQAIEYVWNAIREGAARASLWVAEKVNDAALAAEDSWARAKDAAAGYFESVVGFSTRAAGFLWHFGDNMKILWEWLRTHWRELAQDVGNLAASFVEETMHDLVALGTFIVEMGKETWFAFWDVAMSYARHAYEWLSSNWKDIVSDMGEVFRRFAESVGKNFNAILGYIGRLASHSAEIFTYASEQEAAHLANWAQYQTGTISKESYERMDVIGSLMFQQKVKNLSQPALDDMLKQLSGPDFSGFVPKTSLGEPGRFVPRTEQHEFTEPQFSDVLKGFRPLPDRLASIGASLTPEGIQFPGTGLYKMMDDANKEAGGILSGASKDMADSFNKLTKDLHGPFDKFRSAITEVPKFLTDLPEDWDKQLWEGIKKVISPTLPSGETDTSAFGGGKVSEFRQVSLARYVMTGSMAESLAMQELNALNRIENRLGNINDTLKNNAPPPAVKK